jgi:REP-associated tyrosine transposase
VLCPELEMKTLQVSNVLKKRKSTRLPDYDYTLPGAYFITICTNAGECIFGEVIEEKLRLNQYGEIVNDEWIKTAQIRSFIELDSYIIMPDHFHGIVIIKDTGTARRAPTAERFSKPVEGSLSTVIRSFKSAVTRRINILRETPGQTVWQRGYYEHVIRHNEKINLVREYIAYNPARWSLGRKNHHPAGGTFKLDV